MLVLRTNYRLRTTLYQGHLDRTVNNANANNVRKTFQFARSCRSRIKSFASFFKIVLESRVWSLESMRTLNRTGPEERVLSRLALRLQKNFGLRTSTPAGLPVWGPRISDCGFQEQKAKRKGPTVLGSLSTCDGSRRAARRFLNSFAFNPSLLRLETLSSILGTLSAQSL